MTIYYGDNNPEEKSVPGSKVNNGDVRGKMRVLYDTFTFGTDPDDYELNDVIVLGGDNLNSARIHDVQLIISGDGPATTGALQIGLESDPDAFFTETVTGQPVAVNKRLSIDNDAVAGFLGLSGDNDRLQATLSADFTGAMAGSPDLKIEVAVYYTEE